MPSLRASSRPSGPSSSITSATRRARPPRRRSVTTSRASTSALERDEDRDHPDVEDTAEQRGPPASLDRLVVSAAVELDGAVQIPLLVVDELRERVAAADRLGPDVARVGIVGVGQILAAD